MGLREDREKVISALDEYEKLASNTGNSEHIKNNLSKIKEAKDIVKEIFFRMEGLEK